MDLTEHLEQLAPPLRRLRGKSSPGVAWLLILVGCSGRPSAVEPVDVDPKTAAGRAMELFDKDGDRSLSDVELKAIPGVHKVKSVYDPDGDGSVSETEFVARLESWQEGKLGFISRDAIVTLRGRPLVGAEVELTPEEYLGDAVKPAGGVSVVGGVVELSVAPQDLPAGVRKHAPQARGMTVGTYRVRVTHPSVALPASASDGSLGLEISADTLLPQETIALQ